MKANSIKFKVCVLYVALLGMVLFAYRGILYFNLYRTLYNDSNSQLKLKAEEVKKSIDSYLKIIGQEKKYLLAASRGAIRLDPIWQENKLEGLEQAEHLWLQKATELDLKEDYIQLLTQKGRPLVSSHNMDKELCLFLGNNANIKDSKEAFSNIIFKKNLNLRMISMPLSLNSQDQYILQVATSAAPIAQALKNRIFHTAISIPIILLFIGLITWLLVGHILSPVFEITRTAKQISYENLNARVKVENIDEEMKYLAEAFNEMIARLEKSFQHTDEFNFHVAHELKTPLAIIKGESALALRKERDIEEYKRVLLVNLEEAEKMLRTIDDLLLLSKLDHRSEAFKFEPMCLNDFLSEIYEQSQILASAKYIRINMNVPEERIYVTASRLHLRRLFFNLIDNAIKFTPREGSVELQTKLDDKKVIVSVRDTGAGIAEDDLQKIFKKFFKSNNQAHAMESGHGLGLSIAESIAKVHDGDITVESQMGKGSIFNVILPLA